MATPPRPLPPALASVFTVADARAEGATSGRMRAKDLDRPFHGVRRVRRIDEHHDLSPADLARLREREKIAAYAPLLGTSAFIAGRSAAVHWDLPVDPGGELVVGVLGPHRGRRAAGVRGVKVSPRLASVREHLGVRVTSPATTWAMLAGELGTRELVVIGDAIVRVPRGQGGVLCPDDRLASIDELRAAADAGRRVGAAKLRAALPLIRDGSASPLETEYRLDAAAAGLPDAELDVEIRDAAGGLLGISEIVYRDARVVVEIEGDHHRTDRSQWNRDIEKYAAYVAEGWEVVRLTSQHIRRTKTAASQVRAVLARRGAEGAR